MPSKESPRSLTTVTVVVGALILFHPVSFLVFMYLAGRGLPVTVQRFGNLCFWPEQWLLQQFPMVKVVNLYGEAAMRAHNAGATHETAETGVERPLISY